jgi:poly-gamma-glutamate capsule biosynthesis protein CapA/YwtB (metallophosphatase superfamily)
MCFKQLLIFLFCITTLFISCGKPQCVLYIDDTLRDHAQDLLGKHPLPQALDTVTIYRNPDKAHIMLTRSMHSCRTLKQGFLHKTVSRQWLAPVALLWEEQPQKHKGLLPLEEIALPLRGLPVNGAYPGDEDYPYCEEIVVSIKKSCDSRLLQWFDTIKEHSMQSPLVWIGAVGDIMPGRGLDKILMSRDEGMESVFNDTWPVLLKQDLMLGNLEGTVTDHTVRIIKNYNFKFKKQILFYLTHAGFDYLSLTNNHSFDYGLQGFTDTLENFRTFAMPTSGAGRNLEQAKQPWCTTVKFQEVRVLSVGAHPIEVNVFKGPAQSVATQNRPGILWEGEQAYEAVKSMCSENSFDVVMVHSGEEISSIPDKHSKNLYHKLINLGVDVVFAAHPHVLQGMEVYKNKLIAYSLGNFIFPEIRISPRCYQSMILVLGVYNSRIVYVRPIPVQMSDYQIKLDKSGVILKHFYTLTKDLAHQE